MNLTGGNPPKPYIFIEDIGTTPNGYSDPLSRSISIFNYVPEPDFHSGTMKSWWRTVSIHEYTHHAHLLNVSFPANILRLIFGKIFLPNMLFLAAYMHEGIAVYSESNLDSNDGRLDEGYFDAYLKILNARKKLRDAVYLNHDPADYPQGEIVYLMGSEFTEFLIKKYSERKLKKYFTTVGKIPIAIPLIDIPALLTYKKSLRALWGEWKHKLGIKRGYYLFPHYYADRGYHIKFLRNFEGKIYYVKTNYKRLSWNWNYHESNLCVFDPESLKIDKFYIGDISLPPVVSNHSIYFGIRDIKKGNSNISNYGLYYTNAIIRIDSSGKLAYLFDGRIRAFDVSNDTIIYVIDETEGSSIWKFRDEQHEKIAYMEDLKIHQILSNGESLYLLGHRELEGNQIYRLSDGRLEKIISLPFEIGYFQKQGNKILFPGNYQGKWCLFLLNLKSGEVKIFDDQILAYYPAMDSQTVYYVAVDADGEYIKTASISDFKGFKLTFKTTQNQNKSVYSQNIEKVTSLAYLKELLYPDLILPTLSLNTNSLQNLKDVNITFEGIQLQGHSPLNLVEYMTTMDFRDPRNTQLTLFYNGIPATSIAFSLSGYNNCLGFGAGHILYIKNLGYLRQVNLYGELYPWAPEGSFSSVILTKIYPDIYQNHSLEIHYLNRKITTSFYHLTSFPVAQTFLLQGEFGINYIYPSRGIEHAEDLRLTLPFIRLNWGNDALIHLFYERNFLSLKFINASKDDLRAVILSLDHLLSIIRGNLKVAIRAGLMKKIGEPIPYIFITLEPSSINFSRGIFRKRWLLREITGRANLL